HIAAARQRRPQIARGLCDDRHARAHGRDPAPRRAARRSPRRASVRDRVRGGVAEINYTLIPLMQDAGLEVEWRIIRGAEEFYNVTKTIHNALQGNPQGLDDEQKEIYGRYQGMNADEFEDNYDFVVVHDPQPL